ncbi:MAG TPA: FAD-dependent oxidoreductase [Acetobacteraceae bacterium]|nr:FAD-dependent oxidoreductase [Acetobacteraceae bacterium]
MERIVVLGGGFAGLWAAIGAARKRGELGIPAERIEILLIDRTDWHAIRVRNYEADLAQVRVRFDEILSPVGIRQVRGEVEDIDLARQRIAVRGRSEPIGYDRLVFALGSALVKPSLPGLAEHAFDVDTYEGAIRLGHHLAALPSRPASIRRNTVLVVGAGLTGIEVATEMPGRLAPLGSGRVILTDHAPWIGSDMGEEARTVIDQALAALEIETRPGTAVASIDREGAVLASGDRIDTETVIWCAGMRSHVLTARFPVLRDRFGRLPVDPHLKVKGLDGAFAAGDSASLEIDGTHTTVMSCQHARPMGRFAGHNVVCDLLGKPMLPLRIGWYVTVLDLGPWGALYTQGWDRHVVLKGAAAKRVKRTINCERIYPPLSGGREALLEAAAALVQPPPAVH